MISHTALLSRVTLDVNDRQSMTSINQIVNNVTGFTIKFVTAVGWRSVSIVYGLLTALMLLICFWGVREHLDMDAETEEVKVETVPLKEAVPAILKNKYFYLVAALFILTLSIASGNGSMTVYYKRHEHDDITFHGTDTSGYYRKLFCPCNR